MSGTLIYRRSGYPPVYSVYIDIELPQPQEPKVHLTRFREESYVSGGGCGSCGYQLPVHVYHRTVSRTQRVKGAQVQVGRWVYQFAEIRPDDQIRLELYEAGVQQEMASYTATNTGFIQGVHTASSGNAYDDGLEIIFIDGNLPARTRQNGNRWWEQTEGVMRVRNGFAMRGLIAMPVPAIDTTQQRLLHAISSHQGVKEPVQLN